MYDDEMETVETMDGLQLQRGGGSWRIRQGERRMSNGLGRNEDMAREEWERLRGLAPCRECGEKPFGRWQKSCQEEMDARGLCFHCNHWTNKLSKVTENTAIIQGSIYEIGESELAIARRCHWPVEKGRLRSDYQHVLGHGGAEFEILFDDGRRVTTTNLWAGGLIPAHFRGRLPDNATFGAREHSCAYVGLGSASL